MLKPHCSCLITIVSVLVRERSSPYTKPGLRSRILWGKSQSYQTLNVQSNHARRPLKTPKWASSSFPTQSIIYACTYEYCEVSREIMFCLSHYISKTLLVKKLKCEEKRTSSKKYKPACPSVPKINHIHTLTRLHVHTYNPHPSFQELLFYVYLIYKSVYHLSIICVYVHIYTRTHRLQIICISHSLSNFADQITLQLSGLKQH